ncbi:iron-sulfur flavoprotein [Candidatus Methanomethylophilus sp. 1R26]|jgi:multimeric flavodoxin WrbA|uniref:flavodoxin family protein n=1 Tax=Candidatus Methanomethylophilus sp. 1R26 TaxID=1769296 RepID=UPI000737A2FF|nr:flavodoxin family protein [Candidatus Methanomethylophilus sp. 1R26]MCH3977489.1 flavodoxin family protein [Methanomethylophilus sp.]TQS82625.1 MAG: iron-sulfur flavoprotein [Methanomethylophilus alvi]KUE73212.1 iron-sulfur flavoprotein [Candidatus Methanomethylophilus sp. 1R26]MCI2075326.1 flavodoxin family protein [Methanomethylophilus sp.]MCI2092668.1 flavodoxin family protein [Methanomethylophilus sp.]
MKVVILNGSSRLIGNTSNICIALSDEFERAGIETEQITVYDNELGLCNDCRTCEMRGDGRCIIEDDDMNDILDEMRSADGIILAAPAYGGSVPSNMQAFLERADLCLSVGDHGLRGKVGGVVTVCAHEGGELAYGHLTFWLLRNEVSVAGAFPLPLFRALDSPGYEKDEAAMKGLKSLAANMSRLMERNAGLQRGRQRRN